MSHARVILKTEAKGRNWGEVLGRDWRDDWQAMLGSEVHKDAVIGITEKHIKDPALVKRLADAWDSAVDLGVTTAKASPAQKRRNPIAQSDSRLYGKQRASCFLKSVSSLASGVCIAACTTAV